jgi:hypothetical protein
MLHHCRFCLYEAFAIALDEKAVSPAARLLYDNAEHISLSANDIVSGSVQNATKK